MRAERSSEHRSPQDKAPQGSQPWGLFVVVFFLLLVSIGGIYLWTQQQETTAPVVTPVPISLEVPIAEEVQVPVVEEEEAPPVFTPVAVERVIVMPPGTLEGSDAYVKKAIADLAPAFSEWLMSSQQIRKWILTIDLMADGTLIKQDRPLSFPMERFEASPQDDTRFLMSSSNFTRTDLLINALVAIDVDHLVYYYQKWLPLLDKAYQELGKRGSFHGRVKKAIDQVTNAKPFAGEALLEKRGGVMYRYVDPTLESASDVEKLMWRLGPENSAKLQSYLKQVRAEMP